MITLHNYSEYKSFIKLNSKGYEIISSVGYDIVNNGTRGFSESGGLFGLYVYKSKLYFHYNNKNYDIKKNGVKSS